MNGPFAPRAELVNRARDELLARAALALDQHRARDGRHLLDLHQHLAHRVGLADQPGEFGQPLSIEDAAQRSRTGPPASTGFGYTSTKPMARSRSMSCGSATSASPITAVPSHSWSRTTWRSRGSAMLPVSTMMLRLRALDLGREIRRAARPSTW